MSHYRDEGVAPAIEGAESAWYEMCGQRSIGHAGGVVPYGCLATSGYGDGLYPCFVTRRAGQVMGVAVDFLVAPGEAAMGGAAPGPTRP